MSSTNQKISHKGNQKNPMIQTAPLERIKKIARVYFTHPSVQIYLVLFAITLGTSIKLNLFESHALYCLVTVLIAPFFEWFAHKILLHRIIPKTSKFAFNYQLKLHYNHHTDPSEVQWIFAPLSGAFAIFIFIFLTFSLIGLSFKAGFMALTTAIAYFLLYEWVHLGHHTPSYEPFSTYGKFLKKAHQWHHYSHESYWWGVTSHLPDLLFKSFPSVKETPHSPSVRDITQSIRPIPPISTFKKSNQKSNQKKDNRA